MEPIRFYAGQESGVVIEKENFSQSVFYEKYQHTFEIFSRIWESKNDDISNIIAICGDRGEGKTSLLKTVQNIFRNEDKVFEKAKDVFSFPNGFKPSEVRVLDVIDPAFFDARHNLIELLLGQMYGELRNQIKQDEKSIISNDKTKLLQQFDKVKNCLSIIRKQSDDSIYDKLEELDKLAAGMQLKEELDRLFEYYSQHFGAERLIICIDDLDLNMSEGYQMAEEMRKYLCNSKRCIVLVALKVEQMNEVIASYLRKNTNNEIIDKDSVLEMANHYITKLLPLSHRIWMPYGPDIAERGVIIIDRDNNEHPYDSVKDAVVRLIFQKTRYIFVNGRALSPIVPTNMRNLRHLLGSLFDMPPAKDNENKDNVENKRIFKQYFFHKWIECLSPKDYKFVTDLVKINDYSVINKDVVTFLAYKFPKGQVVKSEIDKNVTDSNKNDTSSDVLLRNILDFRNTMYNISIGDVFYVMQRLDQTPININTSNLIFFIRSFYAIKLYEAYDIISANKENMFKEAKQDEATVYKYDIDLQRLNMMQRIINGSYFTYLQDELLPLEDGQKSRDIRLLNGVHVKNLFENLKNSYSNKDVETERELYYKLLNLCEFFALTLTYPVGKDYQMESSDWRRVPEIVSLREPVSGQNYWIFDVLSIFYNIINYKMAYNRFSIYFSEFYKIAKEEENSLLNQMLMICSKKNGSIRESLMDEKLHGLISDAAIRTDTVLMSILDAAKINRDKHKTGVNEENIRFLYTDIQKLGITLYSLDETTNKGYQIPFNFLTPIINFLDKVLKDKAIKEEFDRVYETHIKRPKKVINDTQQSFAIN